MGAWNFVTEQLSPRAKRCTVGASFSGRHNSLNFLRLVFALLVVVSHSFVGHFVDPTQLNQTSIGTLSVYGFFAISGYLIANSASHNSLGRYLWQRFLRIFPGFWVCLVMTGFFFAAIGWFSQPHRRHCGFTSCYIGSPTGPFQYVYRNLFLVIHQSTIANTPQGTGWTFAWNAPLWTLSFEFLCYLLLAGLALVGLLRRRQVVALLAGFLWACELILFLVDPPITYDNWAFFSLTLIFFAGAVLYLYRDRVPDSGYLALGCAVLFLASPWLPIGKVSTLFRSNIGPPQVLAPFIVYPVFWLGIHLPFQKVGA